MDSTLVRVLLVCLVVLFVGMVATIVLLADAIPESVPVENVFVDVDGDGPDATFTFTGAPKATMPDTPEDLAETPTA